MPTDVLGTPAHIKAIGDAIVQLTILEAKSLGDYLEIEHGIKPAAAKITEAPPSQEVKLEAPPKTEFDVILESFGTTKINVIKVVRAATGLGLKEAKELVEAIPSTIRTELSKSDAEKLKKELEDGGGTAVLR